ncbi:hypothetical protein ABZP36_021975 [Zizania latifolia]
MEDEEPARWRWCRRDGWVKGHLAEVEEDDDCRRRWVWLVIKIEMDELKECKYLLPMAKEHMEIKMMLQQMACKQRVFQMMIFSFLS